MMVEKEKEKQALMAIEVTVISAEGLLLSRTRPVKKGAFVVVRSDPINSRSTGRDDEGGSYPAWNEKLAMELPASARFITAEARSGSKLIGAATIPVSDFAGGSLPVDRLTFLSYRLRSANGGKNGILNLSVKVRAAGGGCSGEMWARGGVVDGVVAGGGVVVGVPVNCRY